jgi:photosystem II stability/assembly factor-like uncharacterized protein
MLKIIFSFTVFLYSLITFGQYNWTNLDGAPYNGGKQDGIFFIDKNTGWVVNGSGKIYKTNDGGLTWIQQRNSPGTYFRSVAFVNDQVGFAGNVGPNYFPGVTDANPLYKTIDGGNSWASVTANITGIVPTGICAIQVVNENVIYAAGRVGTPTVIMKSIDGGNNWVGTNLSNECRMILDIHFQTDQIGYVFAGTSNNINNSKARILRTTDGGATWTNVFTTTRTYEIFWKASFPSENVGFATIQSYNTATTQRYIVKTTDGGLTWTELPLANSGVREFGIGFINENVGWVGGEYNGYETLDGGLSWTSKDIGQYANKMSVVSNTDGSKTCYAVGLNVYKMETSNLSTTTVLQKKNNPLMYPNPATSGGLVSIALDEIKAKITKAELIGIDGKSTEILFNNYFEGTRESPFMFYLPSVAVGEYIVKFTDEKNAVYRQKILITK